MKVFSLKNLSSDEIFDLDPRKFQAPEFESKEEFRAWCNEKSTDHCFYSHVQGQSSRGRANSTTNPPYMMYGFTADYDSQIDQKDVLELIDKNAPENLKPTWVSTSFSGHVRLTWEFEEPVMVDQPELAERFLHYLGLMLKADKLSPGLDSGSFKLTQYFEAGRNWNPVPGSRRVPSRELGLLFYRAAKHAQIKSDGYQIPIEAVASAVEERWPGRCNAFEVGARVPLFWVEPFEDRVGAQVGDHGVICYSTRAGKSFVSWGDILGPDFIRSYMAERIGAAVENLYFDGKHYWRRDEEGGWRARTKEDTIMWLKGQGISTRPAPKKIASEAEEVLLATQERHEVSAAAPIVHDNRLLVQINGDKILNTSRIKLLQPAETATEEDFPWLHNFFNKIWSEPQQKQRAFFLAWLQHAYKSCMIGRPAPGQAMIIAGPPSSGKTFLNYQILSRIFGGHSDATEFLMGRTNFNKQDSSVFIWAIDDSKGSITWENKATFSAALKKHVANPQVRSEAKGKDAVTVPFLGRICLTCNLDIESLNLIPNLNATIRDKVMLTKWGDWKAPFLPNRGTEDVVARELPYFLRWLLDWTPPAECISDNPRYVVNPFHHHDLLKKANSMTPAARLREILALWISDSTEIEEARKKRQKLWVTSSKLRRYIASDPGMRQELKEFSRWHMNVALEELGVESREHWGCTEFLVYDPEKEESEC